MSGTTVMSSVRASASRRAHSMRSPRFMPDRGNDTKILVIPGKPVNPLDHHRGIPDPLHDLPGRQGRIVHFQKRQIAENDGQAGC